MHLTFGKFRSKSCPNLHLLDTQEKDTALIKEIKKVFGIGDLNCYVNNKFSRDKFLNKYSGTLNWNYVVRHFQLSDEFIDLFYDNLDWNILSYTQKLSNYLYNKYNKNINFKKNWLYISNEHKLSQINKIYKTLKLCDAHFVVCYKAIKSNLRSIHDDRFVYDKLYKCYETVCDYNEDNKNSNGFGFWTYQNVINFVFDSALKEYRILKCLVPIECLCYVPFSNKLRSSKFMILKISKIKIVV